MKKIIFILLLLFLGCGHRNEIIYRCVHTHVERQSRHILVGKIWTTQYYNADVCDERDWVYYDDDGVGWRIEIEKTSVFSRP